MEELFGIPDDSEESEDAAHDVQSLLWSVKIDEESFLEIIEKCRLRRLLRQANYGVEESMNQLFEMMDKVWKKTGFTLILMMSDMTYNKFIRYFHQNYNYNFS